MTHFGNFIFCESTPGYGVVKELFPNRRALMEGRNLGSATTQSHENFSI